MVTKIIGEEVGRNREESVLTHQRGIGRVRREVTVALGLSRWLNSTEGRDSMVFFPGVHLTHFVAFSRRSCCCS